MPYGYSIAIAAHLPADCSLISSPRPLTAFFACSPIGEIAIAAESVLFVAYIFFLFQLCLLVYLEMAKEKHSRHILGVGCSFPPVSISPKWRAANKYASNRSSILYLCPLCQVSSKDFDRFTQVKMNYEMKQPLRFTATLVRLSAHL